MNQNNQFSFIHTVKFENKESTDEKPSADNLVLGSSSVLAPLLSLADQTCEFEAVTAAPTFICNSKLFKCLLEKWQTGSQTFTLKSSTLHSRLRTQKKYYRTEQNNQMNTEQSQAKPYKACMVWCSNSSWCESEAREILITTRTLILSMGIATRK